MLFLLFAINSHIHASQYFYDSRQRLTRVIHPDGTTVDYVYDALGNRLRQTTTLPGGPTNRPPARVSNPSVRNGAFGVALDQVLGWAPAVDPDNGDSVVYLIYFGTAVPPPLAFSGAATNWSPGVLRGSTLYWWQVVARDSHNTQTVGPLWQFTTRNELPVAKFSATPTNGMAPLLVAFSDRSSDGDGSVVDWRWDFNGDGTVDSTDRNGGFTYTAAGDYTVILSVHDDSAAESTVVMTNLIHVTPSTIVDLAPSSFVVQSAGLYRHLAITYSITNRTTNTPGTVSHWADACYLSTNTSLTGQISQVGIFYENQAIPGGTSYTRTNLVTIPPVSAGNYYLLLVADLSNQIVENNDNNNLIAIPLTATNLPDLTPGNLEASGQAAAGQPIQASYTVTNQSLLPLEGEWYDYLYLSTNSSWTPDATVLSGSGLHLTMAVGPGAAYSVTNSGSLPNWPPGAYYLILRTDNGDAVVESSETNNSVAIPITLAGADLAPVAGSVSPSVSGRRLSVVTVVTNLGAGPASGYWLDGWYWSTNATWETNDVQLAAFGHSTTLAPGRTYTETNALTMPANAEGPQYVLLLVDYNSGLGEGSENNNLLALAVTNVPDLRPLALELTNAAVSGEALTIITTVTNHGTGVAGGSWSDNPYLSTNAIWDTNDFQLSAYTWNLAVPNGQAYRKTNSVTLPNWVGGNYYLILRVDRNNGLYELSDGDNELVVPVTLSAPDLSPVAGSVSPVVNGRSVSVVTTVTNLGNGAALGNWNDGWYWSTNITWEAADAFLSAVSQAGPVAAGSSYQRTNTVTTPATAEGSHHLLMRVDYNSGVYETDEGNNVLALAVTSVPDLRPLSLELTNAAVSGEALTIITTVTNQGTGIGAGSWSDYVYLSTDTLWDTNDFQLNPYIWSSAVTNGQSYRKTNSVPLPNWVSGSYYLILRVDRNNGLYEVLDGNNDLVVPVTLSVPDLAPVAGTVSPVVSGRSLSVATVVTNTGNGPALGSWSDGWYWSSNTTWEASDPFLTSVSLTGPVLAGSNYTRISTVAVPTSIEGTNHLLLRIDYNNGVYEIDENNNLLALAVTNVPDLRPLALELTNAAVSGEALTVITTVTNQGTGIAAGSWSDYVYLSTNAIWDASDFALTPYTWSSAVTNQQSYRKTHTVTLPNQVGGDYYLILRVDRNNGLYELSDGNNELVVPVTLSVPDLAPVAGSVSPVVSGRSLSVVTAVTNLGNGSALGNWTDGWYWSTNTTWEASDTFLTSVGLSGPVAAGSNYTRISTVNVPANIEGTNYLLLRVDYNNGVYEMDESNNVLALAVTNVPDLLPAELGLTNGPLAGRALGVVTTVTNRGTGVATGTWADYLYLSTNSVWDATDIQLPPVTLSAAVTNGQVYRRTNSVTLPNVPTGSYYLISRIDRNNALYELSDANNTLVLPMPIYGDRPLLEAGVHSNGQALITVYGPTNVVYILQTTTNLNNPIQWLTDAYTVVRRSNYFQILLAPNATNNPTFFRALKP